MMMTATNPNKTPRRNRGKRGVLASVSIESASPVARGTCAMTAGKVAITHSLVEMSWAARTMSDAVVAMTSVRRRGRIRQGGASVRMATKIGRAAVAVAHATNPIDSAPVAVAGVR
jgi:hypothetical protein